VNKLKFGTGGVPLTTKSRKTIEGVRRIKELGLDNMEVEFVYGVKMKND
jgi:deoxyribonuclease-4